VSLGSHAVVKQVAFQHGILSIVILKAITYSPGIYCISPDGGVAEWPLDGRRAFAQFSNVAHFPSMGEAAGAALEWREFN
jgi:hypothetical protein